MINFKGDEDAYFLPLSNKHGLSTLLPSKLFTSSIFSFVVRVKVDWDEMGSDEVGGILAINGQHTAILCRKTENGDLFLQCDLWKVQQSVEKPVSIYCKIEDGPANDPYWKVDKKDDWYNIVMVVDRDKQKLKFQVNDKYMERDIDGDMIEYDDAMIWLGCCNGLSICPPEHRWNFKGTIDDVGIFLYDVRAQDRMELSQSGEEQVDKDAIPQFTYGKTLGSFFSGTHQEGDFDHREIIFMSNLKEVNSFKIYDESNNGNHFVKYKDEWI
jgi:hypothetical protein